MLWNCDKFDTARNTQLEDLEAKLDIMRKALEKIAACRGYVPYGDIVRIANTALSAAGVK